MSGLAALFAAAAGAYIGGFIVRRLWRRSVLDIPDQRSSHTRPVTRLGGLSVVLGLLLGTGFAPLAARPTLALLLVLGLAGGLGLWEDVWGVPVLVRLGAQTVAAGGAAWVLLAGRQPWGMVLLAVLWIVAFTNEFNFMDGIDGLAGIQLVVVGASWLVMGSIEGIGAVQVFGAVTLGCGAGFLPHNVPRARVFMGDAGAYGAGAWLAVAASVGVAAGVPLVAMLAPLALTGFDTTWTLLRRAARRENLMAPHQDHLYQGLVLGGWTHLQATAFAGLANVALAGAGMLALADGDSASVAALATGAGVVAVYAATAERVRGPRRPARPLAVEAPVPDERMAD